MSKQPAFQFYPADWLKDTELHMCSMSTHGIWINLLCRMWEQKERGKIAGKPSDFLRLLSCTKQEWENFVEEVALHKFADVTFCNEIVTVINRRMYREDNERKAIYNRVLRHRQKQETEKLEDCNANVTVASSSSSSSSSSEEDKSSSTEVVTSGEKIFFDGKKFQNILESDFADWDIAYPAVNISQALQQMAEWIKSNPAKGKKSQWRRFITGWLGREQERGGGRAARKNGGQSNGTTTTQNSTPQRRVFRENTEHAYPDEGTVINV